jgi:hypothetical protein
MLKNENFKTIAMFIYLKLLCQWGAIEIIVTDNTPQYLQAVKYLAEKYHIHHIKISPYNSRAQGPIERRHYDVREAIVKATDGDISKWPDVTPSVSGPSELRSRNLRGTHLIIWLMVRLSTGRSGPDLGQIFWP